MFWLIIGGVIIFCVGVVTGMYLQCDHQSPVDWDQDSWD